MSNGPLDWFTAATRLKRVDRLPPGSPVTSTFIVDTCGANVITFAAIQLCCWCSKTGFRAFHGTFCVCSIDEPNGISLRLAFTAVLATFVLKSDPRNLLPLRLLPVGQGIQTILHAAEYKAVIPLSCVVRLLRYAGCN